VRRSGGELLSRCCRFGGTPRFREFVIPKAFARMISNNYPAIAEFPIANYIARALPVRIEDSFALQNYKLIGWYHVTSSWQPGSGFG
jgi:hypothetical protein